MPKALHIHPMDNVAVCTSEVQTGDIVEIVESDGSRSSIKANSPISFCNKIALRDIDIGDSILKYGEIIGKATSVIPCGTLVNHENITSQPRSYAEEYMTIVEEE